MPWREHPIGYHDFTRDDTLSRQRSSPRRAILVESPSTGAPLLLSGDPHDLPNPLAISSYPLTSWPWPKASEHHLALLQAGGADRRHPDGTRAYVVSAGNHRVFVIGTGTGHVISIIPVAINPDQVAVSPDGTRAYITHSGYPGSVSVIDTAPGHVTATIHRLCSPWGVAVSPSGTHIYVTNTMARGTVSVITASNHVPTRAATATTRS